MYKLLIVFLVTSCGISNVRNSTSSWGTKKHLMGSPLTVEEYCTYCSDEGDEAAFIRYKEVAYSVDRKISANIMVKNQLSNVIKDWIVIYGIEHSLNYFSRWYGYRITEYFPHNLAVRVVNDVQLGYLPPASLGRIRPGFVSIGEDLYRTAWHHTKMRQLRDDIDTYASESEGYCGVCVHEEGQKEYRAWRKEILSR